MWGKLKIEDGERLKLKGELGEGRLLWVKAVRRLKGGR